jgi:sulfonate transport system substrate-binding protein
MTATPIGRRRLLQAGAGLLLSGLRPALAQTGPGPDLSGVTLRVAQYTGGDVSKMMAAAGVADTPYRLQFSTFASGNLIVEALNAGALDVGQMSETPPVFGALAGAAVKIVAVLQEDTDWQVVLVPKDSPVRTVADLRGKRVGYVRATTTHYYLARMLKEAGLSFTDVEGVALTPSDGQAAFDRGALDAFAIYGYNVPFAIANGARVLKRSTGYLSGNYPVTARAAALDDPLVAAALGDYLGRLKASYAWIDRNLGAWADIWSKAIGVPRDTVAEILTHPSQPFALVPVTEAAVASLQGVADTFFDLKVLPRRIEAAPLFDRRYHAILAGNA